MVAPAGVHPVVGESGVSETNLEQEHALIGGNMATSRAVADGPTKSSHGSPKTAIDTRSLQGSCT
jgi:hypothetical protein